MTLCHRKFTEVIHSMSYRPASREIVAQLCDGKLLFHKPEMGFRGSFSHSIGRRFDPYTAHHFHKFDVTLSNKKMVQRWCYGGDRRIN